MWPFKKKQQAAIDLSAPMHVEFTAEGKTIRVDPFEAIDWLVELEKPFDGQPGHGYLSTLAAEICRRYELKSCSLGAAYRFQEAVVSHYTELRTALKKKNGSKPRSPTGSASIPPPGQPAESMSGLATSNGYTRQTH